MKAYSVDLREKIVAAVLHTAGCQRRRPPALLGVGATSVKRYMKLQEERKPLTPGKAPGKKSKLGHSGMKLLEEDLHARPTLSYEQRADYLFKLLSVRVSTSTICRMIKRLGYIRKRDRWVQRKATNG